VIIRAFLRMLGSDCTESGVSPAIPRVDSCDPRFPGHIASSKSLPPIVCRFSRQSIAGATRVRTRDVSGSRSQGTTALS
jgi:hypothetical protein